MTAKALREQAKKVGGDFGKALRAQAKEMVASAVGDDVMVEKPTVNGLVVRQLPRAVVTDFAALVRAVVDGKVPLAALVPDQSWLNAYAGQHRDDFDVPGCELRFKESVAG